MDPSDGHEPALAARVVHTSTNFDVEIYAGTYMSSSERVRFT
jgi:hypothetical protein